MKKNWIIVILVITLMVVSSVAVYIRWSSSTPVIEDRLIRMVNTHLGSMNNSQWFMESADNKLTPEMVGFCANRRNVLLRSAAAWCTDDKIGREVKVWLPEWGWGIINSSNKVNDQVSVTVVETGKQLVVFRPHVNFDKNNVSFFCNQEKNGRAIFITALKMPDQIYAAFTLHEIGHAVQYWRLHKTEETLREVEMHILTQNILDVYSQGAYRKAITEIVDRQGKIENGQFKKVFKNLKLEDLSNLDRMVGSSDYGKEVESCIVIQHLLSIGFAAVDKSGGVEADKVEVYEWVNHLHTRH